MTNNIIELVKQTQLGDGDAFAHLYETSLPYVMKKCYQMGAPYADAQDITQEVMIKVHAYIQKLREPKCYYGWLSRIITNTFHKYYRKNNRYVVFSEEYECKEEREYMLPECCIETLEKQSMIIDAMHPLKEKLQEVLVLYYLKEMSEKEIAKTIDRPLGTVKSRLYCARQKMRLYECSTM